jgi:hypothetical protein
MLEKKPDPVEEDCNPSYLGAGPWTLKSFLAKGDAY